MFKVTFGVKKLTKIYIWCSKNKIKIIFKKVSFMHKISKFKKKQKQSTNINILNRLSYSNGI